MAHFQDEFPKKRILGAIACALLLGFFALIIGVTNGWKLHRTVVSAPAGPVTPYIELRVKCEHIHGMRQFDAVREGMTFQQVTRILRLPLLTKSLDEYSSNTAHISEVHVFFRDPAGTVLGVDFKNGIVRNKTLGGPPPEQPGDDSDN